MYKLTISHAITNEPWRYSRDVGETSCRGNHLRSGLLAFRDPRVPQKACSQCVWFSNRLCTTKNGAWWRGVGTSWMARRETEPWPATMFPVLHKVHGQEKNTLIHVIAIIVALLCLLWWGGGQ
mmetsp:Transcript_15723/g.15654  ORF Transcript_15723/g.15654 Transcript_15723/m.15654 type:complete len:123 (+) Transcript_15723:647-1015(+)